MIDLYAASTPNARKVTVALEELALPYRIHKLDLTAGDQFKPDFVAINPNAKSPALVDSAGPEGGTVSLFESGAILVYLAENTGSLLPTSGPQRYAVMQWLMFQMSGLGPMFGQLGHFIAGAPERIPYAIERYQTETLRLFGVLDKRLSESRFVAGEDYTIADITTWPHTAMAFERLGPAVSSFDNLRRWHDEVGARAAVQRGMAADLGASPGSRPSDPTNVGADPSAAA